MPSILYRFVFYTTCYFCDNRVSKVWGQLVVVVNKLGFGQGLNRGKEDHRRRYLQHNPDSCCCCFSHSAHWLPTRKKLLYTVANPARGLLNRENMKKEKVWQRPPPAARCLFGENTVRNTGIRLKVDEEPKKISRGPQQRSERRMGRERT